MRFIKFFKKYHPNLTVIISSFFFTQISSIGHVSPPILPSITNRNAYHTSILSSNPFINEAMELPSPLHHSSYSKNRGTARGQVRTTCLSRLQQNRLYSSVRLLNESPWFLFQVLKIPHRCKYVHTYVYISFLALNVCEHICKLPCMLNLSMEQASFVARFL